MALNSKKSKTSKSNDEPCKGLFWRASVNNFLSKHKSIETRKSLRFLKTISCPGCDKCYWFWEFIGEDINCCGSDYDYAGDIKHSSVCTYKIESSTDFESGVSEIVSIEFVKVVDHGIAKRN